MKMKNEGTRMTSGVGEIENTKGSTDVEKLVRRSSEEVIKKAGGVKRLEDILSRSANGDLGALNELRKLVEWSSAYFIEDDQFWGTISEFIEDVKKEDMTPEYQRALRSLKIAYARFSIHASLIGFVDMLKKIGKRDDVENFENFEKCIDDMFAELNGELADESCVSNSVPADNVDTETAETDNAKSHDILEDEDDDVDDADADICDKMEEQAGYIDEYGYIVL